jgi:hypothetical protein
LPPCHPDRQHLDCRCFGKDADSSTILQTESSTKESGSRLRSNRGSVGASRAKSLRFIAAMKGWFANNAKAINVKNAHRMEGQ